MHQTELFAAHHIECECVNGYRSACRALKRYIIRRSCSRKDARSVRRDQRGWLCEQTQPPANGQSHQAVCHCCRHRNAAEVSHPTGLSDAQPAQPSDIIALAVCLLRPHACSTCLSSCSSGETRPLQVHQSAPSHTAAAPCAASTHSDTA
jgi:hypothetical protein